MSREAAAARQIPLIQSQNHKYFMWQDYQEILENDLYYCIALALACVISWDLGWLLGWLITA